MAARRLSNRIQTARAYSGPAGQDGGTHQSGPRDAFLPSPPRPARGHHACVSQCVLAELAAVVAVTDRDFLQGKKKKENKKEPPRNFCQNDVSITYVFVSYPWKIQSLEGKIASMLTLVHFSGRVALGARVRPSMTPWCTRRSALQHDASESQSLLFSRNHVTTAT